MLGKSLLSLATAISAVSAVTIQVPGLQSPIVNLDIHVETNDHEVTGMGQGNDHEMSVEASEMLTGAVGPAPSDMSVGAQASLGQWDRGIISTTSGVDHNSLATAFVNSDGTTNVVTWNGTWFPGWHKSIGLGGNFNRSISILDVNGTVAIVGTTMDNNLVLKYVQNNLNVIYPKSNAWIILDEVKCVGTPALASHDNKTLSIVATTVNGQLLHKLYNFDTDTITNGAGFKSKVIATNPALIPRPDKSIFAYGRQYDGTLFTAKWTPGSNTWSDWASLGANFTGSPTTIWQGPRADLVIIGTDGAVYNRYFAVNGSLMPNWLVSDKVAAVGTATAYYFGKDQERTQIIHSTTSDIRLTQRIDDKITGWSLGGQTIAAPAAAMFIDTTSKQTAVNLWVVGTNSALFFRYSSTASWNGWDSWYSGMKG